LFTVFPITTVSENTELFELFSFFW